MQSLTNRSKVVAKKEMTFSEKIYLPAILGGLKITFRHLFKRRRPYNIPTSSASSPRFTADSTC